MALRPGVHTLLHLPRRSGPPAPLGEASSDPALEVTVRFFDDEEDVDKAFADAEDDAGEELNH